MDYGKKSNAKESMDNLPKSTQKSLRKKGRDHNSEYGDDSKRKLTNVNYLAVSYHRGIGAYNTNPSSVRPTVKSPEQWAMARVNGLLYALRNLKFKRKPYDTDLLPEQHPHSGDGRAVGDVDPTNFPKKGDNKKVSLRNSQYPLFPTAYARKLKENHPKIWKLGGNIRGNDQYEILTKIQRDHNGVPQTPSQEAAIRRREAWMARHLKDFRIAGVIAQVKWLGIGSRGLSYMKNLIQEEIKKREKSDFRSKKYVESEDISEEHQKILGLSTPEKYDVDYTYVPFPSEYETRKELLSVREAMRDKSLSMEFIRRADEDIIGLFLDICSGFKLNIDNSSLSEMKAILDESSIAIIKLKYLYNRARPYQIAEELEEEFPVLSSVSAHTPSYPSGHSVQALLLAKYLAGKFPHRMRDFYQLANDISWSRIEAGYHFPSDIHYGEVVFKNIVGDISPTINLLSDLNLLKTHNIISDIEEDNAVKEKIEEALKAEDKITCSSFEVREDGKKVFQLKGRIHANLPIQLLSFSGEDSPEGAERSEEKSKYSTIEGIASSTSVDTYGTEMSLQALRSMKDQIAKGVPILPRHNSQYNAGIGEWDDVIGRTMSSSIMEVRTAKPADRKEKQYVLNVRSVLYNSEPKTAQLMERLKRSEPIGQSVGGWFEDVEVIEDRGEVERVIIKGVTLDHIAITRAPANPDSHSLVRLSAIRDAISGHQSNLPGTDSPTIKDVIERAALPFVSLPKAPADMEWDWNTEAQNAVLGDDNWKRYAKAHLYRNEDMEEDVKGAYKLPIAKMVSGELRVVLRGVQAAMAALNGARGGVDIPESDRRKIYDNIKRYYELFEKEAPPLRSIGEIMKDTDERMSAEELSEKERMLEEKERMLEEKAKMLEEKERMLDLKSERAEEDEEETPVEIAEKEDEEMPSMEEEDEEEEVDFVEESRSAISENKSDENVSSVNNAVIETRNSATSSNGDNMTENDIGKIAALINNAVKPLNERMDALENTSTAKPVEKTQERSDVSELKRKLDNAENLISRMMQRPLRSGIHTSQTLKGPEARSYLERAIDGARADGSTVLARTAEHAKEVLMEEKVPTHHDLVQILAAGIRAAEADGIINTETNSTTWK